MLVGCSIAISGALTGMKKRVFFLPYSVVNDRESHQEKKVILNYLHYF